MGTDQFHEYLALEELPFQLEKKRGYLTRGGRNGKEAGNNGGRNGKEAGSKGGRNGEEAGNNHSAKGYLWQLFSVPLNMGRRDQSILNLRTDLKESCASKWREMRFKMEGNAL